MRLAAYLLSVMLLGIGASGQDTAKQSSNDQPSAKTSQAARLPLNNEELASFAEDNDTCYTIRAYFFRPSADGGVEPAGMTTCVKSTQRALKRARKDPAKRSPEVRLVH